MIASTATDTANNNLDTGTISFSEVKNSGYYDVDSMPLGANVSTTSFIPTPTAPTAYHNGDKQDSTTQSAIANGNLTVRNKDAQKQDVDTLSHDTANANTKLDEFFNKDKEQDRMDTVQMVKDVTVQIKTVGTKIDRLNAQQEVDNNGVSKDATDKAKNTLGANATKEQIDALAYSNAVDTAVSEATKNGNNIAGIGSGFNKAVDAGASLVTGVITGDVLGGIAGASAPYLATAIKNATGHYDADTGSWKTDDTAGNYVLHGMLGAGVAAIQGNSVLAGAVGAAGGEFAANTIREQLYGNRDVKDLTESEKQDISNWSQIASGAAAFAGSGGNMGAAGTAMSASKNSVENNYLSATDDKKRKDAESTKNLIEKGTIKATDAEKQELDKKIADLNDLDVYKDQVLKDACQDISSSACGAARANLDAAYKSYFETLKSENRIAYNDAYATYSKYYDGNEKIESLTFGLDVENVKADREVLAQRISENLNIDKDTADAIVTGMHVTQDLSALAAAVVGQNSVRDNNLHLDNRQMQIIKNAEGISIAKSGTQTSIARDLNEQLIWNQVEAKSLMGSKLKGMNNDPNFDSSAGFQKMQAVHTLSDGQKITVHYQYNIYTKKAYDMKIVTPQRTSVNSNDVLNSMKERSK